MSEEDILPPISGHTVIYSDNPEPCAYLFGGWDGKRLFNDLWMWRVGEEHESGWHRLRKPEEALKETT